MIQKNLNKETKELEKDLKTTPSFRTFAEEMDEEFLSQEVGKDLSEMIRSRGIKKASLFMDANIHEVYGYQILSGKRYPSRDVLLSLFLSMRLDFEEANRFLKTHGFTPLYVRRKFDAAIAYSLMNGLSVLECNELLYENGLPLLKNVNS